MINDALERVAELLPASWHLEKRLDAHIGDRHLDAVVELVGPGRTSATFAVEHKAGTVPASLLIPALRDLERTSGLSTMFVSDYIGPTLRQALESAGLSYADATGWIRLVTTEPLILLTGRGAPRARPDRSTSAVVRLNGLAAGKIVRALTVTALPVGVRALAGDANVSPGSVSKLLVTLAAEGIVERGPAGDVVAVRRRALLKRWALDYSFARTNPSAGWYIAPRGLDRTLARLGDRTDVALTGSAAARRQLPDSSTPVVPLRLLAIYAARPTDLADGLGLIKAEPSTANVVTARPQDPDILVPSDDRGLGTAPLPLVIADLLTLPGRSDAEAEQLMDVLAATDDGWKE